MGEIEGGFILVARRLVGNDSWLMQKPPIYLKLWVWMLGQANFKDREKLKRGQFVTSISDMQKAMAYRVGYRLETPTKDEIRSAYEAFAKATMITTTKTIRGMIVTVCNYSKYQNLKSYETHNEPHDENATKPTVTPHDTERMLNNGKNISSDALQLSGLLADLITGNNPGNRTIQPKEREKSIERWAVDIDRMLRLDGRKPDEVEEIIRWCQEDAFWQGNVLSGEKLRKQFDQLVIQMQRGGRKGASLGSMAHLERRII